MYGFACEEAVDGQREAILKHSTSKLVLISSQSMSVIKL